MPEKWCFCTYKIGVVRTANKNIHLNDLLRIYKIRKPFSRHKAWVDCQGTGELFFKMVKGYSPVELMPQRFADVDEFVYRDRFESEVA